MIAELLFVYIILFPMNDSRTRTTTYRINSLGLKAPRGYGWLTNPKKAAYNRVYNRTSFSIFDVIKKIFK